jgi:L-lactate dehydrogenase complex protein LldG
MSAAREAILAAVRNATAGATPPAPVERSYRRDGERTPLERIDLLCERLVDYRANVRRVRARELRAAVEELAPGRIGVPPGLPQEWRPPGSVEDHGLRPHELDALDAVLTGCTAAVAETGTLVLAGGPTEGRRALTLVPDLHVCVVRAEQVVETVPEAFEALRGVAHRPLTFVSGPSATSDIELKRVEGVHGPRRLVVVIVEEG